MANNLEKVAEQALCLSGPERMSLVRRLLESVESEIGANVDEAWEQEIDERITKIDAGLAVGRPWEAIKTEFDSRFKR